MTKGSGTAAFLGSMTAMAVDPVMVATMGIGAPAAALKGAYTAGQAALRLGVAEAVAGGIGEAIVQVPVYNYKQQLGRDYDAGDVVGAIGASMAFSGVIGAGIGGMVGAFRQYTRAKGPDGKPVLNDKESLEINQLADDLDMNPDRLSPAKFRQEVATLVRMTPDELQNASVYGATATRREMAGKLLEARDTVKKAPSQEVHRRVVEPEYKQPEAPTGPGRTTGRVTKASDPEYVPSLQRALDDIMLELGEVQKKLAKKAPRRKTKDLRAKEKELETTRAKLEKRIEDAPEPEKGEIDVPATLAKQEAEEARVDLLEELDQKWLEKQYQEDLLKADMEWARALQRNYETQARGEINPIPEKSPRQEAEARGETQAPVTDRTAAAMLARGPQHESTKDLYKDLADQQREIDSLKAARACLNGN